MSFKVYETSFPFGAQSHIDYSSTPVSGEMQANEDYMISPSTDCYIDLLKDDASEDLTALDADSLLLKAGDKLFVRTGSTERILGVVRASEDGILHIVRAR